MRLWIVLLLLPLAGCLAEPETTEPQVAVASPPAYDWHMDGASGVDVLADLKEFTSLAPRRYDNLFDHAKARSWLETQWVEAGLNVTRGEFSGAGQTSSPMAGQNIIATIAGQTNFTIIIGAHFDSAVTSAAAAYDDGTGTMLVIEMGRALNTRQWNHTIILVAFDQEEAGLVGSSAMAQQMSDEGVPVAIMINLDMVGINWPAGIGGTVNPIPLNFFVGGAGENEFVQTWQAGMVATGYPVESSSQSTGLGGGSSDHGPFRNADFPAAWLRGALIGSYPAYHNVDTVEAMTAVVGGDEANLVAGFQTVLDLTLAFVEELDRGVGAS